MKIARFRFGLPETRESGRKAACRFIAIAALSCGMGLPAASAHPDYAERNVASGQDGLPREAGVLHAQNAPRSAAAPRTREQAAQALFDEGVSASERGDSGAALAAFEQLAQRFGRGDTPAVRTLVARALFNKGNILGEQGDDKKAIATYERLDRRFGNDEAPATRGVVASALISKAETLYEQGNTQAAIAVYEQIGQRFGSDDDHFIRNLVSIIRWRTAEILVNSETPPLP
ncbi:MAG: tetratricopeptide repeat protein [Azoarcus sp.]|jgi:TolA-binding protein|nr:tetratricopeptide repeat protein [Azoarcus sp.]